MVSLVAGAAVTTCVIWLTSFPRSPADQASITSRPLPRPIVILRGLAFSATGICKSQHTSVVAGGDIVGVEVVTEDQLAAEHAAGAFGGEHLPAGIIGTLERHGHYVAFDVQVERIGVIPGRSNSTTNPHPRARRPSASRPDGPRSEDLLGEAIKVHGTDLSHQHGCHLQLSNLVSDVS